MIAAAERAGKSWRLYYSGRSIERMPFLDELDAIAAPDPTRLLIRPGTRLNAADIVGMLPSAERPAVYVCGPAPLIEAALDATAERALFFAERFVSLGKVDAEPFEIEIVCTGQVIQVPGDATALAALLEVRPDLPYSCRQGFCGTCRIGTMRICTDRAHGRVRIDV
jgi:ferredoxin-NADP reductase